MRKNNMRKWFHLIIDFIPLFIIPIFAININQKSVEPISVDVQVNLKVDFNQRINPFNEHFVSGGIDYNWSTDGELTIDDTNRTLNTSSNYVHWFNGFDITHKYALVIKNMPYVDNQKFARIFGTFVIDDYALFYPTGTGANLQIYAYTNYTLNGTFAPMIYDLTQMGLEDVTKEELNTYLPQSYYPYTLSQEMYIQDAYTTTYDNTDIGSQFIYSLYKPVHDYFNISELGGFNQFYQWIEINFFNGTAPLPFFIVFNIMMYNFIVDLIFLLYSVFMFIIDFAENCLNRFYPR